MALSQVMENGWPFIGLFWTNVGKSSDHLDNGWKMIVWKYVDNGGSGQPAYPLGANQVLIVNQGRVNL